MFNEQFIWESPKFTELNNFKYDRLHECYCWILEHGDEFTGLQWSLQSPDLSHLWYVMEQEIGFVAVQQLCDAIMSVWTRNSKGFKHLVESKPWRVKVVLKA